MVAGSWSAFQVFRPHEPRVLAAATVHDLRLGWSETVDGAIQWGPVAADREVYVGSASELVAFDQATGRRRWIHPLDAGSPCDLADLRPRRPPRAVELDRRLRDPAPRLLEPLGPLLQLVLALPGHFA